MLGANYAPFQGSLRVASGCLPVGYHMASGWPRGAAWDAVRPVPPKTAKSGPQPPKSAIESHLRFAESFRVHGPISTSEFAAVSTPPPRNNSLRYSGIQSSRQGHDLPAKCSRWHRQERAREAAHGKEVGQTGPWHGQFEV